MINKFLFLLLGLVSFQQGFSTISAGMNVFTYYEDQQPYIEINMHIVGSSVTLRELNTTEVESEILAQFFITQENDTIIADAYRLKSPKGLKAQDFIHLQRYKLAPGNYRINVVLTDILNIDNTYTYFKNLEIDELNDDFQQSKTKLLASIAPSDQSQHSLFKYGYIMEPAAFHFFHKDMSIVYAYKELYNVNSLSSDSLRVDYKLIEDNVNTKIIESKTTMLYPSEKNLLIEGFSLKKIPSGNYIFVFDIHRNGYHFVQDTVSFQRSNPALDTKLLAEEDGFVNSFIQKLSPDELDYALKGLAPRLGSLERGRIDHVIRRGTPKSKKFYLYNYWVNYDPINTERTFNQYMDILDAVDKKFYSAYGRGFETDRGYVFLRYGQPDNVISVEDEPTAPPYQIWFYDRVDRTGQSNVKFLFYNPNLGAYHYELLHSTCRGELQNRQWEIELYRDAPNEIDGNRMDATTMKDNYNRRAREYFEDQN